MFKGIFLFLTVISSAMTLLTATPAYASINFNDPNFDRTWNRVDKPVQDLPDANRGYTWGPVVAGSETKVSESYNGGTRKVQYFDKARMEVNNPDGDSKSLFYVTTGLLVKELVTGNRQDGDNIFTALPSSQVQIAGDTNENGANNNVPTYTSFKNVGTFFGTENGTPSAIGNLIKTQIDKAGNVSTFNPSENRYLSGYDSITHHNIADVFIDYFNQEGLVWNGQSFVKEAVFFGNPLYVFGRPITEPYWVKTYLRGVETDVMVQLYERRVLTYTPSNPEGYRVEMGNVGQHYYRWRYVEHPSLLLSQQVIGNPITSGNFIFWLERTGTNQETNIVGYNISKKIKFAVDTQNGIPSSIVTDGRYLVWIQKPNSETSNNVSIQGYDLEKNQLFDVIKASPQNQYSELALDNGVLYYNSNTPGHIGLYGRYLTSGQEFLISQPGSNLVANDGVLLWTTGVFSNGSILIDYRLHATTLANTQDNILIAKSNRQFSGYSVSQGKIVWSLFPPEIEPGFYLYDINSKVSKFIAIGIPARNPVISGSKVGLVISPGANNQTWRVALYDINSTTLSNIASSSTPMRMVGITQENRLIYTTSTDLGKTNLYISF